MRIWANSVPFQYVQHHSSPYLKERFKEQSATREQICAGQQTGTRSVISLFKCWMAKLHSRNCLSFLWFSPVGSSLMTCRSEPDDSAIEELSTPGPMRTYDSPFSSFTCIPGCKVQMHVSTSAYRTTLWYLIHNRKISLRFSCVVERILFLFSLWTRLGRIQLQCWPQHWTGLKSQWDCILSFSAVRHVGLRAKNTFRALVTRAMKGQERRNHAKRTHQKQTPACQPQLQSTKHAILQRCLETFPEAHNHCLSYLSCRPRNVDMTNLISGQHGLRSANKSLQLRLGYLQVWVYVLVVR